MKNGIIGNAYLSIYFVAIFWGFILFQQCFFNFDLDVRIGSLLLLLFNKKASTLSWWKTALCGFIFNCFHSNFLFYCLYVEWVTGHLLRWTRKLVLFLNHCENNFLQSVFRFWFWAVVCDGHKYFHVWSKAV